MFPPDGRTPRPGPPAVPAGPEVIVSMDADRNRLRTFPSLMRTPYEHQLLEWHATGQIGIVDVATGAMTKFGTPGMITAVDMNPTGKYAQVTRMTKPFSFIVPTSSFGSIQEIWDASGKALAKMSERPLNLGVQATPDPVPDPTNPQAPAAQAAAGGGRGGAGGGAAANNGRRDLAWRADGEGFNYLQLEPAPAAPPDAGRGRAGGGFDEPRTIRFVTRSGTNTMTDADRAASASALWVAHRRVDAQAGQGGGGQAAGQAPPADAARTRKRISRRAKTN